MIDLAATSLSLRENRRSVLNHHSISGNRRSFLFGAAALIVAGGSWFVLHNMHQADATPAPVASAVPVNVMTLKPAPARIWTDFSGKLDAVDFAEIRPEVSGRIIEIRFRDGQVVNKGDVLFVIDPRPYQAAAAKAAGDLHSARVNADLARSNLARAESLKQAGAIALQTYDQNVNAKAVADASIESASAALTQAQLDIDHAYVKAPISGRVSRAEITVGNLVQTTVGQAPLLTSIVSKDGIYADFDVDEQTYVRSIHGHDLKAPVEMTLPGDSKVYHGVVESFDNRINTGSGTIRARARFDNTDGALVPGMFVSVRLASPDESRVLLVPERAIGADQSKSFVYVVDGGKATFREVTLGATVEGSRVIASGLKPGDRVIVDGTQHIMPGAPVQPQDVKSAGQ